MALSVLWLGGVVPEARAVSHALLFCGCLGAAALPAPMLSNARRMRRVVLGLTVLWCAILIGLFPVPHAVLQWLAPGTAAAYSDGRWWSLSLSPEATAGEAAFLALLIGMGALAGTWGAVRWRRSEVERAVLLGVAGLVGVGAAHLVSGATDLFGRLPTSIVVRGTYFAPFVNPNHFAAALLVGLPVVAGVAFRERRWSGGWAGAWCTLLSALGLLMYARSRGAVVALCAVVLLATLRVGRHHARRGAVFLGAGGLAFVAVATVLARAGTGSVSLKARMAMWLQALRALGDSWFAGTGGGTFERAIEPYRSDNVDVGWAHLHNDPLEWLIETGLVGAVALVVATWLLWPRRSNAPERGFWLDLGLVAILIHSLVEFPLQMPGIALSVVALLAVRRTVFEERSPASAASVRSVLVAVALLQVPAGAWMARTAVADRAVEAIRAWKDDPVAARSAADTLRRVAPWRPEIDLLAAWEALAQRDASTAIERARGVVESHPHDARTLRQAALVLASAGAHDDAWAAIDRATQRAPDDWRTAVARARLETATGSADAADAWQHAIRQGAPAAHLEEAFSVLPVGLVWLDALRDRPTGMSRRLANLLVKQGDLDTALLAHEQAAAAAPPALRYHPSHVALLINMERLGEAERLVNDALQAHPTEGRYLEQVGEILEKQGRHQESVDAFIRASPVQASARVRVIRAAERAGGLPEVLRVAKQLELVGALDPRTKLEVARARANAGDRVGCAHDVEAADLTRVKAVASQAEKLLRECRRR